MGSRAEGLRCCTAQMCSEALPLLSEKGEYLGTATATLTPVPRPRGVVTSTRPPHQRSEKTIRAAFASLP